MSKFEATNSFTARGVLMAIYYNEKKQRVYRVVISSHGGHRPTVFLNCIPEEGVRVSAQVRDYVDVTGYIRGYSYDSQIKDRRVQVLNFITIGMKKAVTPLAKKFGELGVSGKFYGEQFFEGYISGKVTEVEHQAGGWHKITIKTVGGPVDRRASYVFAGYPERAFGPCTLEPGDYVCATVFPETNERECNEKTKTGANRRIFYQNIVLEDVEKVRTEEDKPAVTVNQDELDKEAANLLAGLL